MEKENKLITKKMNGFLGEVLQDYCFYENQSENANELDYYFSNGNEYFPCKITGEIRKIIELYAKYLNLDIISHKNGRLRLSMPAYAKI